MQQHLLTPYLDGKQCVRAPAARCCGAACSGVPFAFSNFPLEGLPPGFPVWFDINLAQVGGGECTRAVLGGLVGAWDDDGV